MDGVEELGVGDAVGEGLHGEVVGLHGLVEPGEEVGFTEVHI